MKLRPYQQRSIDQLYDWMSKNAGNPCVVLPTGAGKSVVIAELIRRCVQEWPETRVLMLSHVKEILEQNASKMRQLWPGAPMGIYSASIGRKELGEPITFAGIQSVRTKASQIGHIDLCIIDECHTVSHKNEGGYRGLLSALKDINPSIRIIGYSATPYRLGHGLITDEPALFHELIEPVTIEELVHNGFLSTLRSKPTGVSYDLTAVHKRGGEYIESELQAAVDNDENNAAVVDEVIRRAEDRKAWLFFCTGIHHAAEVARILNDRGIPSACITGETPKGERQSLIDDFKTGRLRALTNANVLTTGFDYPDIDLIAMLRPTMSPGLYVQMAGRGLRLKSHTDHCLVLDFAGVVARHGPITAVQPPSKAGEGNGEAPVRACEHCHELCHISAKVCPACGEPFPEPEKVAMHLRTDDIMGLDATEMGITSWNWRVHTSRSSGKEMLAVTYYGALSDKPVTEYLTVTHDGYAGEKARRTMMSMAHKCGVDLNHDFDLDGVANNMNAGDYPTTIEYRMDGKYHRVVKRNWEYATAEA